MARSPLPEEVHRPTSWQEYIGQEKLKTRLQINIAGALSRKERLDHVLLVGPPGCGKTSLALLIAQEMHVPFVRHRMPMKPVLWRRLVRTFRGVVLLDEIHRSSVKEQEELLTFIEDGYIQTDIGESKNPWMTVVAATTEKIKVIDPLQDRFVIKPDFDEYTTADMRAILLQMARKYGVTLSHGSAATLARACAGTPRLAKDFVLMARDLGNDSTKEILKQLRVTNEGLSRDHLRYLDFLCRVERCGLVVLKTHLRMSAKEVEKLEILLVKRDLISQDGGGRIATLKAYQTMKVNPNA